MDHPIFYIGALAFIGYFFWTWLQDFRANVQALRQGSEGRPEADSVTPPIEPVPGTLPGATPVRSLAVVIAVVGALVILGLEVAGEYGLDIVQEQTEVTLLFGLYTLAAAFVEELIFRGFLYYDKGSKAMLVASIVLISVVFALLHQHIWVFEPPPDERWWDVSHSFSLDLGTKALFSTAIIFMNSLWFYFVRFFHLNPFRSLIPCFAAHLSSNLGVLLIKAAQGKLVGLY